MHGGSGVNPADYMKSIKLGIRKINCYTYMAKAGGVAALVAGMLDNSTFHEIVLHVEKAMKENAKDAIKVFMGK